jgi:WD40 repeat protein
MTPAVPLLTIDEQNPWPGLSPFDEASQRFFNGRREESAALRRLVMQAPLTVLFAASGLGKTSLVQAGLFPLLRKDILPVYVRLDARDREAPLIDQATAALQSEIRKRHVDAPEFRGAESLWEYLHRVGMEFWSEENQLLTPLFVFDQFEEVFTLGAGNTAAVTRLRTDLADLIENRMPASVAARVEENESASAGLSLDSQRYKVLLSFREDFLPAIEGWKRDLPSILRNRLRLLPMSGEQAFEAVNKTAPHLAPEPIARRIVSFVAAAGEDSAENSAELEVEVAPALLSVVCHGLNERRKEHGKTKFDEALLAGTGQAIVADFYRNAVAGLPETMQRFIERELITERGFRKPYDVDDARTVHGVTDRDLALLVDRRVLRIEPARGSERVELTHDLLTRVVREQRDHRRERDRLRRERRRRLTLAGVALGTVAAVMAGLYVRANEEKKRADDQATQAKVQKGLADEAMTQKNIAEAATTAAHTATLEAEREARAALSHQLSGAAINAEGTGAALLFALNALAITRDKDHMVLPDAEDALRQAVDAMHRVTAAPSSGLDRPGHTSPVKHITFSRDGTRVATVGEAVRIWDVAQGEEIRSVLPGSQCNLLEFSQDLNKLACGDAAGLGSFLNLETKETIRSVGCRGCGLRRMGFSPNGQLFVWEDGRGTHVSEGALPAKVFPGHDAVISPNGNLLATIVEKVVKVWDVGSGSDLRTWDGTADRAVFSPDGKELAINGQSDVYIWELPSGKSTPLGLPDGNKSVRCIAFSADLSRLAVLGLLVWQVVDIPERRRIWSHSAVDVSKQRTFLADTCGFTNLNLGSNGRSDFLIVNGRYDRGGSHGEEWYLELGGRLTFSHDSNDALAWSEDGTIVAIAAGPAIGIPDYRPGTGVRLPERDNELRAVAFTPDATRVVTSGDDGRARVWDVKSGRKLLTLIGDQQAIFFSTYSPDGNLIVTAGMDRVAKLWDAHSGRFVRNLALPPSSATRILAVAFTADNKRILASGDDLSLITWDAATGGVLPAAFPFVARPDGHQFGIAFSADGKRLALVGPQARAWDLTSGREFLPAPGSTSTPAGIALSRDGEYLAVAESNGVRLWSRKTGWKSLPASIGARVFDQVGLAFRRDGKRLVTPGTENTVRIWDTATAQEVVRLYYDSKDAKDVRLKAVAYSPDEKQIYAIGTNWAMYHFPVPFEELQGEARRLVIEAKASLTDGDCGKYLHQNPCPQQVRRIR